MRKLVSVILAVLTCFSLFAVNAKAETDDTSNYDEGSFTINATFDVHTVGQMRKWSFEYNDEWFKRDACNYNHKLAKLSIGMAVSAFRPNIDPKAAQRPELHLKDFLIQAGFLDLRTDDYDKNPTVYTVSTVIAEKVIEDNGEEFVLLTVGICGGGYSNEWMSNFSCGDEGMHVGFESAAREVFDRVCGYIASNRLSGRKLKVWVSGFSRAAAISNVLATLLVDSDLFDEHRVFAYTFATPRTTKNPHPEKYHNIFNICGKMDPVPQLAFADWGYDRYGLTFYTPAQQTDSDYSYWQEKCNVVYRQLTGIDHWSNVEWDTKLRLILNYFLKLAPTSEVYYNHMQEKIIDIWGNKTLPNILSKLMDLARDEELINDKNRSEANSMLTYIAYMVYGYAAQTDIDAKYRNSEATILGNLAHEHTPDVYIAWLFSSDWPAMFSDQLNYLRFVIDGDVDVSLLRLDYGYTGLVKQVKSDGSTGDSVYYLGQEMKVGENVPDIFMERTKGETIIILPKDADYYILVKSNQDQRVEMHGINLVVGRTNGNFSQVHYVDMKPGENHVVISRENADLDAEDGVFSISRWDTFNVSDISNKSSTEFAIDLERANILNLSWKHIILIVITVPIIVLSLIILIVVWLIGAHRVKRKKKHGELPEGYKYEKKTSLCMSVCFTLFLLQEVLYWLMPDYLVQRSMLKLGIGLLTWYLCWKGYRKQPSPISKAMLVALAVFMVADVTITFSFRTGMYIFALAEGLLCYWFFKHEPAEKWQYILWGLVSAIVAAVIMIFNNVLPNLTSPMIFYAIIVSALVSLSLNMPKKIRFGSILIALSNILLFVNEVSTETLLRHVGSLGIYYLAIGLFAYSSRYRHVKIEKARVRVEEAIG